MPFFQAEFLKHSFVTKSHCILSPDLSTFQDHLAVKNLFTIVSYPDFLVPANVNLMVDDIPFKAKILGIRSDVVNNMPTAFALRKGFPHRRQLDSAVVSLQLAFHVYEHLLLVTKVLLDHNAFSPGSIHDADENGSDSDAKSLCIVSVDLSIPTSRRRPRLIFLHFLS